MHIGASDTVLFKFFFFKYPTDFVGIYAHKICSISTRATSLKYKGKMYVGYIFEDFIKAEQNVTTTRIFCAFFWKIQTLNSEFVSFFLLTF